MIASISLNLAIIESPEANLRASPGQFFLAVPPTFDPYLPQVVFPFKIVGDLVKSFIAPRALEGWAKQGGFKLRGAYGNGFTLAANTRRALVLATKAGAGRLLVPLFDALVARDCEVAALCGPDGLQESWLPAEVEYRVVDDVLVAASRLWGWADALFASGESKFYSRLLATAKNERLRLDRGWGQVLVHDLAMPCGMGVCYLCSFRTARGSVLNCRDGPVHDLSDWTGEA